MGKETRMTRQCAQSVLYEALSCSYDIIEGHADSDGFGRDAKSWSGI